MDDTRIMHENESESVWQQLLAFATRMKNTQCTLYRPPPQRS